MMKTLILSILFCMLIHAGSELLKFNTPATDLLQLMGNRFLQI